MSAVINPVRLPAQRIALLYTVLERAMERAEGKEWDDLNTARAFVSAYLLQNMPPMSVEIVREAA